MSDYRIAAATKEEWAERALRAEAKLKEAAVIITTSLRAVNWSFGAGTKERENGAERRQVQLLDKTRAFEKDARAFLASMEKPE